MRTSRALAGCGVWLVACLGGGAAAALEGAAAAQEGAAAAQEGESAAGERAEAMVLMYAPPEGQPALGDVPMRVDVFAGSHDIEAVVFRVDGDEVARFTGPPYETLAHLGDDNVPHRFEVLVLGAERELARVERRTPRIQVDDEVDLTLQQLFVTVVRGGERVTGLGAEDFEVFDDGERQRLVTFADGNAALTAALLVDSSDSMRGGRLEAAIAGARAFVRGMKELDEASILLFSDTTLRSTPFLGPDGVDDELDDVMPVGGTALNDHLYLALKSLEIRQGRRVVIVLSDGTDVHSALGAEDVLWAMRRSRSIVYWIELREPGDGDRFVSSWRDTDAHEAERVTLRRVVEESGGRVLLLEDASDARRVFREVLQELREQYVLGYYPSQRYGDGRWHEVRVRLVGEPGRTRVRNGYLER